MDAMVEQFGINPLLLAAQVVNFLLLLFILKKVLYGPILKMLDQRKETIAQGLKNAEQIEKTLLKTEEDREKTLEKASLEATKLLEEATKTANQIVEESRVKASEEIAELVKKGQESVAAEREKMQQEIRSEIADLVVVSLQKVTGKVLTKTDQKKIVEESVKSIK